MEFYPAEVSVDSIRVFSLLARVSLKGNASKTSDFPINYILISAVFAICCFITQLFDEWIP